MAGWAHEQPPTLQQRRHSAAARLAIKDERGNRATEKRMEMMRLSWRMMVMRMIDN